MKMTWNHLFTAAVLSFVLFTGSAFAQRGVVDDYPDPLKPINKPTPIYVGPCAGLNIMGHSGKMPTFVGYPNCPNFNGATGMGIYAGLTMEYLFGDPTNSSSSLIFRAMYNMFPGSSTVKLDDYDVRTPQGDIVKSSVENVLDIQYNVATFEVMYKINPIEGYGLGIVVGPTADYGLTANRKHQLNLLSPNNAYFLRSNFKPEELEAIDAHTTWTTYSDGNVGSQSVTYSDGKLEGASSIRIGLKAGVQYEILLSPRIYIVPALAYNFGITTLSSDFTWRVSPIQVGVDMRIAF